MPIITDFGPAVQDYLAQFDARAFPRPEQCPHCGTPHTFIGHGYYLRKPKDQTQVYRIWLKRWFCKACHTTLSVLPSFLLRFRHYLLGVIQQVVVARFEANASWHAIECQCAPDGLPAPRTIGRWCHAFAAQAADWWAAVQATLAQPGQRLPGLGPPGSGGRAARRAVRPTPCRHASAGLGQDPLAGSGRLRPQRSPALSLALGRWPRPGAAGLTHTVCGLGSRAPARVCS